MVGSVTSTSIVSAVDCNGNNTGAATVLPSNGAGGFTYLWDANANNQTTATAGGGVGNFIYLWNDTNGQTSQFANGLTANNYSVTVTDNNGCTIIESVEITQPAELVITENEIINVGCNGNNSGAIDVNVTGGTGNYTYSWSNNGASQDISNLAVGTYTLTVTDANLCQAFATYSINEPALLTISFTNNEIACFNGIEGEIDLTISGGAVGTYDVSWIGPNGFTSSEEDLFNLEAGEYILNIIDPNGCTVSQSVTIDQPDAPLLATADSDDVICYGGFDGQIHLFPNGGTSPYTFSVDGVNFNGSPTQIGLTAGEYTNVTVMDANGCTTLVPPVWIAEPDEVIVDLGSDTTIVYGQGVWLIPEIFNTTGDLIYRWTPENNVHISCLDCREPKIDSLSTQTSFQLTVIDENGCTAYDVITIFVKKFREVLVPTGFSPNGDGNMNDLLLVHGREGTMIKTFRVYDRWGELVFEGNDFPINSTADGWDGTFDGKEMNPGVFVWYVEAEFEDGATQVFKGQTTLIK